LIIVQLCTCAWWHLYLYISLVYFQTVSHEIKWGRSLQKLRCSHQSSASHCGGSSKQRPSIVWPKLFLLRYLILNISIFHLWYPFIKMCVHIVIWLDSQF
jgi:hypothetical protein